MEYIKRHLERKFTKTNDFFDEERTGKTLAGRVGILTLYSLSLSEKSGIEFPDPFVFSRDNLQERLKKSRKAMS